MISEVVAMRRDYGRLNGLCWEWRPQEDVVDWVNRDLRVGDSVRVLNDPGSEEYRGATRRIRGGASFVRGREPRLFRFPAGCSLRIVGFDDEGGVLVRVVHDDLSVEVVSVPRGRVVRCHKGMEASYPVLRETGSVVGASSEGKPWNALINADNLYALQALCYAYEGKVDYIYIDPPYNTRNRSWVYNNDYVNGTDSYKSSMWLTFMERRLRLAKLLLNPKDSVLCLAIDDTECWTVGNLLKDVFPSATVQMVTLVTNPRGSSDKTLFAKNNEYLFFVRLSGTDATGNAIPTVARTSCSYWNRGKRDYDVATRKKIWKELKRSDPRSSSKGTFYPIFIDDSSGRIVGCGEPYSPDDMDDHDWDKLDDVPSGCRAVFPVTNGKEQRWQLGPDKFRALLAKGYVRLGPRGDIKYLFKSIIEEIDEGAWEVTGRDENDGHVLLKAIDPKMQVKQLWNKREHDNGPYGKSVLGSIIGRTGVFDYPKSLYSVEDALHIFLADKPNALVVDFFAGSGTTGNVVNLMNKRDGGRRQCILVTNNEAGPKNENAMMHNGLTPFDDAWQEAGICRSVTIPRIKSMVLGRTAASGYKDPIKGEYLFDGGGPMSDGLEERWKFYDLMLIRRTDLEPGDTPTGTGADAGINDITETMMPLVRMRDDAHRDERCTGNADAPEAEPAEPTGSDGTGRYDSYIRKMNELSREITGIPPKYRAISNAVPMIHNT